MDRRTASIRLRHREDPRQYADATVVVERRYDGSWGKEWLAGDRRLRLLDSSGGPSTIPLQSWEACAISGACYAMSVLAMRGYKMVDYRPVRIAHCYMVEIVDIGARLDASDATTVMANAIAQAVAAAVRQPLALDPAIDARFAVVHPDR